MSDIQNSIDQLQEKLNLLGRKQEQFSKEIYELRLELRALKLAKNESVSQEPIITPAEIIHDVVDPKADNIERKEKVIVEAKEIVAAPTNENENQDITEPIFNIEKFIGENLLNKIGIAITVIGVGIGAKYSIDNDLISPLTRIILGYLTGIGLLTVGFRLKEKYEGFSAVLVSGAISILYLITFAAYSFYGLIPQGLTFVLMVLFTAFGVFAAIHYNRQVIAHIGLVGAYAVPFLLSSGSGQVEVLFTYMVLINVGILVISFKKYWKSLFYSSFAFTWIIFISWYIMNLSEPAYFGLAMTFSFLYFLIFYATFLAYKVMKSEKFRTGDIVLLLINSFVFYSIGYFALESHPTGQHLLGLFTVLNGAIHFVVSIVLYRQKLVDRNLFFLASGLVMVFITLAIPVQLEGSWVTILWAAEAALLFWIGRTKKVAVYEKLSYPLMLLAFFSLIMYWRIPGDNLYLAEVKNRFVPVFNSAFLTGIFFVVAFVFIYFLQKKKNYSSAIKENSDFMKAVGVAIPAIILFVTYFAVSLEIQHYWAQRFTDSSLMLTDFADAENYLSGNYNLLSLKSIWLINYTMVFVTILSFFNIYKLKNRLLGLINMAINTLVALVFLSQGLYFLSELREAYIDNSSEYFQIGVFNIYIRYISIAIYSLLLVAFYRYVSKKFIGYNLRIPFDFLLHISVLWIASSELIHWLDIAQTDQSYKLGLSILWGIYALFLIVLRIWKKKKHLGIAGFALFGVTLVKLFFYDISHLNTISKTIVFVSLGILLLIISFLYNKYKHLISDENIS